MPISAPLRVFKTRRTFSAMAPSPRTVCQSFPPSSTSPDSRSPSNVPPNTTPIRRCAPGVAPTICNLRTLRCMTNKGRVRTVLRASGSPSVRLDIRGSPHDSRIHWTHSVSSDWRVLRHFAPVNHERRTRGEPGLLRGNKDDRRGDLFWTAHSLERHTGDKRGFSLRGAREPGKHSRIDRPWGNTVDSNPRRRYLQRRRFREPFN